MLESNLSAASSGQTAGQRKISAHFLFPQPEAQKCGKLVPFAYRDLDLEGSQLPCLSHRSPAIVASDPGSHHGELAPTPAF